MSGILNAMVQLVDVVTKGGDDNITQSMNIMTYLLVSEASRQQRAIRNLGHTALGEEEIAYEHFKVNADDPDKELYAERREQEKLADTLVQAFNAGSKRKRQDQPSSSNRSYGRSFTPSPNASQPQQGRGSGLRGAGTRGRGSNQRGQD